ncbi:alpha-ketoglutarate-dependent dioxygenase alkB homolog 7, mitochondrial-like [Limulus polyphemus]|uniref:Alpha-ketoglutarate-dependent dioxygenase alkB homolog 7, mitochondrial-like n=1 Tax=Limulus polyphemus TaxID=6850 RepID=A0ABM1BS00_LIMPO|nr:alpha-ketoglutarate-dependent dioxygenase alkB homolog 7, mitochondrial-like [Limulus polyphemus]
MFSRCCRYNAFAFSMQSINLFMLNLKMTHLNNYKLCRPLTLNFNTELVKSKTSSGSISSSVITKKDINITDTDNKLPCYLEGVFTEIVANSMVVYEDFLNEEEEKNIIDEIEPYMKKLRYEYDHWDDAIHGYRETEKLKWNQKNEVTLQRVKQMAFPTNEPLLKHVHVLDLAEDGYIKPHIDSIRFCGDTIAGLCLLSDAVMKLVEEDHIENWVNVLLKRRSLYVMKNVARYKYTHEVLRKKESVFKGKVIHRHRRISVILRNEPSGESTT